MVREKQERDRQILKEKEAKDRAEGKFVGGEEDSGVNGGWNRGAIQPVIAQSSFKKEGSTEGGDGFLSRGAMGSSQPVVEEKKDDGAPKRPTFFKS